MNCSMMYKAFLFAMVLFLIPVCNAKAETREDLLLIYQDNLSKEQTENVKLFSETLTALGKNWIFKMKQIHKKCWMIIHMLYAMI